jgi:hypothetical protein
VPGGGFDRGALDGDDGLLSSIPSLKLEDDDKADAEEDEEEAARRKELEEQRKHAEWMKKIDILEGTFKSFKLQFIALRGQNKSLASQIEGLQGKVSDL